MVVEKTVSLRSVTKTNNMTREETLKHYLCSMIKGGLCAVLFLIFAFPQASSLHAQESTNAVSIIPYPESLTEGVGKFVFSNKTVVALEDKANEQVVKDFLVFMGKKTGFIPKLKAGSKKGDVSILKDPELKEEAYRLSITADKVVVKASSGKGVFYALQTIRQLLPAVIEGDEMRKDVEWSVPVLEMADEPRFGYRGLMVDVARCFLPKENLFRIIDCGDVEAECFASASYG